MHWEWYSKNTVNTTVSCMSSCFSFEGVDSIERWNKKADSVLNLSSCYSKNVHLLQVVCLLPLQNLHEKTKVQVFRAKCCHGLIDFTGLEVPEKPANTQKTTTILIPSAYRLCALLRSKSLQTFEYMIVYACFVHGWKQNHEGCDRYTLYLYLFNVYIYIFTYLYLHIHTSSIWSIFLYIYIHTHIYTYKYLS